MDVGRETKSRFNLPPSIEDVLAQGAELEKGALRIGDEVNVTFTNTIAEILSINTNYPGRVQELEVVGSDFDGLNFE